jgi:putative toxin-antitoxin system antitoxin component (TIGR02293 family)
MLEQHTIEVMGGPQGLGGPIRDQIELAERIMRGLPRSAAAAVRRRLGLTEEELAAGLGISAKTLQRQAKDAAARLKPVQGDRLYRLARVAAFAEEVLEDPDRAHRWLREPQRGLGNRVPLELLRTEAGAREVEDLLGRIEHGVFS